MSKKNFQEMKVANKGGLTDVPGILVGNAVSKSGRTGCTVILCPDGAVPGVDVSGGAQVLKIPISSALVHQNILYMEYYSQVAVFLDCQQLVG